MISKDVEKRILSLAYVPEHIPKLMCFLSGGDVEFIDDNYLIFIGQNWLILIAYPLKHQFDLKEVEVYINYSIRQYKPRYLWLLTPSLPEALTNQFRKLEDDWYFKIDIPAKIDKRLIKIVEKFKDNFKISFDRTFTEQHLELIEEFLKTKAVADNIKQLYTRLPHYVKNSETAFFLNSYNKYGKLTAFYIVEMAAEKFSGYMIGCTSKINYAPYSSDLLMYELIKLSEKEKKSFINLGIGVNEGIRRFKKKWGGVPFLKYETYEYKEYGILNYFLMR
ncbi:MAG: hypothetical protein NZ809_02345 [Thermodesulfovibrio sp.]|nr:hypothetical protein [Thermodesulfovibrio sp.]